MTTVLCAKHRSSIHMDKHTFNAGLIVLQRKNLGYREVKQSAQGHTAHALLETFFLLWNSSLKIKITKSPIKQLSSFSSGDERKKCQVCATLLPLSCCGRTQSMQSCCVSASPISPANLAASRHQNSCHRSIKFRILGSSEPCKAQNPFWGNYA